MMQASARIIPEIDSLAPARKKASCRTVLGRRPDEGAREAPACAPPHPPLGGPFPRGGRRSGGSRLACLVWLPRAAEAGDRSALTCPRLVPPRPGAWDGPFVPLHWG